MQTRLRGTGAGQKALFDSNGRPWQQLGLDASVAQTDQAIGQRVGFVGVVRDVQRGHAGAFHTAMRRGPAP